MKQLSKEFPNDLNKMILHYYHGGIKGEYGLFIAITSHYRFFKSSLTSLNSIRDKDDELHNLTIRFHSDIRDTKAENENLKKSLGTLKCVKS